MKARLILSGFTVLCVLVMFSAQVSPRPSFNGSTPGCGSGGGCHTHQAGIVAASVSGTNVQITLTGVTSGAQVAGELVNSSGVVVAVNDGTANNPFTLTAPGPGTYLVNAGYKQPSRVWDSVSVTIVSTSVEESHWVGEYLLAQNYPNPFNPTTTIRFKIPTAHHVTITLYDLLGQRVRILLDEEKEAGDHMIALNAQYLAGGVYLYRMEAGEFTQIKKLMVLK